MRCNRRHWCFEPSYCRPAAVIVKGGTRPEATDIYHRSQRSSWFEDMVTNPMCCCIHTSAPLPAPATHDRLFGCEPAPAVVGGRRRGRHVADYDAGPCWSPCRARPPSVDDFTRTHRNVHGDHQPTTCPPPTPADFNEPHTTILGPHLPLPDCCPYPSSSASPPAQFERTKYNVIGPQSPAPLRFPARTDDFVNSSRNLFGPATAVPLRFPQRTSDFDDTKRNVFGPQTAFRARPSIRPFDNTFNKLFGKPCRKHRHVVTPPPRAAGRDIDVFWTAEQSHPARQLNRPPENSFGNTCHRLLGTETPVVRKCQHSKLNSDTL